MNSIQEMENEKNKSDHDLTCKHFLKSCVVSMPIHRAGRLKMFSSYFKLASK